MSHAASPADALELAASLREPRRLGQQLATVLAAEIVSGRIGEGQAFPSADEIVGRFRVSRTVARETVQTLSMLGLVRVQHGRRTEVLPASEWDILASVVQEALRREDRAGPFVRDLYEFRLLIEPQAAAWMAEHGRDEELAELVRLAERLDELAATDASGRLVMEADRDFHTLVARGSGNRVLAAVSRDIREIVNTLWGMSRLQAADRPQVAEQHLRIARAVAGRDAHAASAAMREHLEWASEADHMPLGEGRRGRRRR